MSGISDLKSLLESMTPTKVSGRYVFGTVSEEDYRSLEVGEMLMYREKEGVTLIVEEEVAQENGLKYEAVWGLITLNVHSDLMAVGFLAAILPKLAEAGISVNVISAYYHDHLFVPIERVEEALKVLERLHS